jgi:hypothetical protein
MPNKHFCQGPSCHTNPTSDRFLKSKGIIRGRYAYAKIDETRYYCESDKYFCSQTCKLQWLNENMSAIEMGIPVAFIRERRFTEGYEKATEKHRWGNYSTIRKIRVDNDNDNDRIIP